jgi:hypothetical protein
MAIRGSMYSNRKDERRVQVSMSEDEAKAFVARDKTVVTSTLTAIKDALAKGPRVKSAE